MGVPRITYPITFRDRSSWRRWSIPPASGGPATGAANWLPSGQTVGRGRMDRANVLAGHAPKTVYVYPLGRDIPARLCTAPAPRPLRRNRPGVFTVVRLPRAFSRPRLRDYPKCTGSLAGRPWQSRYSR
jgi:hypothetical protein